MLQESPSEREADYRKPRHELHAAYPWIGILNGQHPFAGQDASRRGTLGVRIHNCVCGWTHSDCRKTRQNTGYPSPDRFLSTHPGAASPSVSGWGDHRTAAVRCRSFGLELSRGRSQWPFGGPHRVRRPRKWIPYIWDTKTPTELLESSALRRRFNEYREREEEFSCRGYFIVDDVFDSDMLERLETASWNVWNMVRTERWTSRAWARRRGDLRADRPRVRRARVRRALPGPEAAAVRRSPSWARSYGWATSTCATPGSPTTPAGTGTSEGRTATSPTTRRWPSSTSRRPTSAGSWP